MLKKLALLHSLHFSSRDHQNISTLTNSGLITVIKIFPPFHPFHTCNRRFVNSTHMFLILEFCGQITKKLLLQLYHPQQFKINCQLQCSNYLPCVNGLHQIAGELEKKIDVQMVIHMGAYLFFFFIRLERWAFLSRYGRSESHCMTYRESTPTPKTPQHPSIEKKNRGLTTYSRLWLEGKHPIQLKQGAANKAICFRN